MDAVGYRLAVDLLPGFIVSKRMPPGRPEKWYWFPWLQLCIGIHELKSTRGASLSDRSACQILAKRQPWVAQGIAWKTLYNQLPLARKDALVMENMALADSTSKRDKAKFAALAARIREPYDNEKVSSV